MGEQGAEGERDRPNTRSRPDYALQASSEINSLSWIDLPASNYENAITGLCNCKRPGALHARIIPIVIFRHVIIHKFDTKKFGRSIDRIFPKQKGEHKRKE